jgi:hypothetical protein
LPLVIRKLNRFKLTFTRDCMILWEKRKITRLFQAPESPTQDNSDGPDIVEDKDADDRDGIIFSPALFSLLFSIGISRSDALYSSGMHLAMLWRSFSRTYACSQATQPFL